MYDRIINTRYRIVREIGKGGMGHVYLALDLEQQRDVAIKTLIPKLHPSRNVGPEAIERFRREANILKTLRHNNIIEFLDYFIEDDNHFIVMEYINTGSLAQRLQEGHTYSSRDVCEMGMSLVSALTAAHDMGIVHRDIKPSNILIAEDGTLRLSDFGVARLKSSSPIERVRDSTVWGAIPGTIVYMAPESLNLGARSDERCDVWSLGVVFYEMLAGNPPFLGSNQSETIDLIRNAELPPVSLNVPYIWPALEVILTQMLTKDPENRYQSMRRIGADLEDALREEGGIESVSLRAALQRAIQNLRNTVIPPSDRTDPAQRPVPIVSSPHNGDALSYSIEYAGSHALLIAPDTYRDRAIAPLPDSLAGARKLAGLLQDSYGFNVRLLTGEEAALDAIRRELKNLQNRGEDDRLLIYWAGAARTRRDRFGIARGFLAAHDTDSGDWTSYLKLDDLLDVPFIIAKHIFVILDVPAEGPANLTLDRSTNESLEAAMRQSALHVLVAGPRHVRMNQAPTTLFTATILQGLGGQAAEDDTISADTLGNYVCQQVLFYSKGAQLPVYGRLPGGEGGTFMFRVPSTAYLPREVLMGVRSAYPSMRHWMVQVLRDFALQPQEQVQKAALDQLEHLAQHDATKSVQDAARQVLIQLSTDPERKRR